jgi:23S rRNA pseudouridine1911/1915/1917 synthase
MPSFTGTVGGVPPGLRLDRYVAEYLKLLNRSQIKTRICRAAVNGREAKLSREIREGDRLELSWTEAPPLFLEPEDIPLDILYEDSRVIVVNKPQGMVVHPGAGNSRGTLANALCYRFAQLHGAPKQDGVWSGTSPRPGIVHRLDKDTSGVIIAAWDDASLAFLADQFRRRTAVKTYAAIVRGNPPNDFGRIATLIARDRRDRRRFTVSGAGGKKALTLYRVIHRWNSHCLVLLRPKTGRTHQLRVHMRWMGNPIAGDPLYSGAFPQEPLFPGAGLMLHARDLCLTLPGHDGTETFRAPLPPRFGSFVRKLEGG